jgi:hypothetical protein
MNHQQTKQGRWVSIIADTAEDMKVDSLERTTPAIVTNIDTGAVTDAPKKSAILQWLLHDMFYIAMLALALVGVVFRLPVSYWVILIPVFGVITVAEGWSHFSGSSERLGLLYRVALNWCALLLAIYLLSNDGVKGVMNANAASLAMMTLLALGTFVAGVQARVWQVCAVGGVLFLAVPGLGWLDQSPLLLTAAACVVVGLGGVAWWLSTRQSQNL